MGWQLVLPTIIYLVILIMISTVRYVGTDRNTSKDVQLIIDHTVRVLYIPFVQVSAMNLESFDILYLIQS